MNFNLAASEDAFANDADAFVIQRIPFPNGISAPEDIETFFGLEMFVHNFRGPIEEQSDFARRMQSGGTRIAPSGKALPMQNTDVARSVAGSARMITILRRFWPNKKCSRQESASGCVSSLEVHSNGMDAKASPHAAHLCRKH